MVLPFLKTTRYIVKFKALQEISLPEYAGSTLRGAFGHALKNIACLTAMNNKNQCSCGAEHACLYKRIFEAESKTLKLQTRLQDIAPPFLVEAHSLPSKINTSEQAHFFMTLFGEFAHSQLMIIQLAWQRALADGLGFKTMENQNQSQLLSFDVCDRPNVKFESEECIRLQFISHIRLQHHGKILTQENVEIKFLMHSLIRRYLVLLEAHSNIILEQKIIESLYNDAEKIIGRVNLSPIEWARWSNRQKRKMQMDGLIGNIELKNISFNLQQLLYWGQWFHLGKGSVFGLGGYVLLK